MNESRPGEAGRGKGLKPGHGHGRGHLRGHEASAAAARFLPSPRERSERGEGGRAKRGRVRGETDRRRRSLLFLFIVALALPFDTFAAGTRSRAVARPLPPAIATSATCAGETLPASCRDGGAAFAPLAAEEVERLARGAAASIDEPGMTVAVVDRAGRVLALYRNPGADPARPAVTRTAAARCSATTRGASSSTPSFTISRATLRGSRPRARRRRTAPSGWPPASS